MSLPMYPAMRRVKPGLLAITLALLSLTPASQAAMLLAGSPTTVAPAGPPAAQGWGGMPMGQRSADAHFIVMMIPHHQGAIAMSELALSRARRPEIKALAQRIIASQSREITEMRQWYRQWYGSDVPSWGIGTGAGYGMGMGMGMGWGMPGFGTSLDALRAAPDFDRAFIEQMIPHHRMGVMMASHAQWSTQHPELRQLEAAMVRVQSQEIEQMAQWYQRWYGSGAR
ncbi:MAG: DUF305 domain-containing protein [Cyanobacteriota bacterium]|jgi:uncharacterized protein (DUF305 family)